MCPISLEEHTETVLEMLSESEKNRFALQTFMWRRESNRKIGRPKETTENN